MDHWDEVARKTVKHSASWYDWCERHGFDEYDIWAKPEGRKYWSRQHFQKALEAMPPNHPDRWKYEVGAKYAPWKFAAGPEDPREFWFAVAPIFLFILLPCALVPVIGYPLLLIPVVYGVWSLIRYIKRYRILST